MKPRSDRIARGLTSIPSIRRHTALGQSTLARSVPVLLASVGIGLAGAQTWAAIRAESMNADGIAYLDVADAYLAGDWARAVNSVWSPLYSWVLAAAMRVAGEAVSEFTLVHLTNLVIFLVALVGFAYLHRELRATLHDAGARDQRPLPLWAWDAACYLAFLYATLAMITVWAVTPDMLMAALVCVAAGIIVRIRRERAGAAAFAALGLALGGAYLAKSVMFPVGILFLAAAFVAARGKRGGTSKVALAGAVFFLISVPWIVTISRDQGRVTFGDAGRITYLRYVNGIPYPYWHGESPDLGTPAHPARVILESPPIHEFENAGFGTNPLSFDPAYWYEGATPRIQPREQGRAVLRSILYYYDILFRDLGVPFASMLLLYLLAVRGRPRQGPDIRRLTLLLPAVAALGMYAMVYVEARYIGVFVLLIVLDLLAYLRLPQATPARVLATASVVLVLGFAAALGAFHVRGSVALRQNPVATDRAGPGAASPGEIATTLHAMGVRPGDAVGVIGYVFDSFWARVAGVRIVAEMDPIAAEELWAGGREIEAKVLEAFASAGARAVVAEYVVASVATTDWQRIGPSNSYVRLLMCGTAECRTESPHLTQHAQ